jgi:hypothetical protein
MRSLVLALAFASVLSLWSHNAVGTPIVQVDGVLNSSDHYTTTLQDDTGEAGVSPNLDISTVTLAGDPATGDAYLGLWVAQGPISTVGAPSSFLKETVFTAIFSDNDSALTHRFDVIMSGTKPIQVSEDGVLLPSTSFTAAAADGLEVMVHAPDVVALKDFSFYGLLDGRSTSPNDDIYVASVPEPVTALLALAGLPMLLRRKQK